MIKAYKIRLFPTPEQEELLWKSVHNVRFVWNWGLKYQMERFKNGEKHLSGYDMKKVLTQLKKQDERKWLNDVSAQTLSMALLDLDVAYKNFFKVQKKGVKFSQGTIKAAARKNKKLTPYDMIGHPKFKKKSKAAANFYTRYGRMYFIDNCVVLEKIGKVKYRTNQNHEFPVVSKKSENTEKFTNPRVSHTNGKWILSFGMETQPQTSELNDFAVGIDLGIKSTAVISYDGKIKHFKNVNKTSTVRKLKKRLKHQQRKLSRQFQTNDNYEKTNRVDKTEAKIKDIHRRLKNIRLNHVHHITAEITNLLPHTIAMESLNVRGMMKNRHLAKAIQEQLWHEFKRQIEYKSAFKGIEVKFADRFYPSSKKCCKCGNIKRDLKLKDRTYKCNNCGNEMDRDENAASNLEGLAG